MDFAQVHANAERQAGYLTDDTQIRILVAAPLGNRSADLLFDNLQREINKQSRAVTALRTGSFGLSGSEPAVVVEAPGRPVLLGLSADPGMAGDLDAAALAAGLDRNFGHWYVVGGRREEGVPHISDFPALALQNRIVLRNCGWIDPSSLHHYILRGKGFSGLDHAVHRERPECLDLLAASAFEDRIRLGSSPLQSWDELRHPEPSGGCVICNAVAAGSGERFVRFLLESDPLSILEGMLIGAYLARASRCILCLEAGSPVAAKLRTVLDTLREWGLAGNGILGTSFCAEIELREVPEGFRPGYLYASVEAVGQRRVVPRMQPECGIFPELQSDHPMVLDPESAAFLAALFVSGEAFKAGFGADSTNRSKVVSLSGSVSRPMMAEIPCGISVRNMIEDAGGGMQDGRLLGAVQIDAPRGGWIGPKDLDRCAHCLAAGDDGTNDGGLDVLDTETDILKILAERMAALQDQSCGICLFCFEGSRQAALRLESMANADGAGQGTTLLGDIAEGMRDGCRCALGRSAARFLRSSAEVFGEDYRER